MSNFCLGGGEGPVVSSDRLASEMWGVEKYFVPGIIHGTEDRILRVSLNEGAGYTENFLVEYLGKSTILEATTIDGDACGNIAHVPLDDFEELLCQNAQAFCVDNNGNLDFERLVEAWKYGTTLSVAELISWAEGTLLENIFIDALEHYCEIWNKENAEKKCFLTVDKEDEGNSTSCYFTNIEGNCRVLSPENLFFYLFGITKDLKQGASHYFGSDNIKQIKSLCPRFRNENDEEFRNFVSSILS